MFCSLGVDSLTLPSELFEDCVVFLCSSGLPFSPFFVWLFWSFVYILALKPSLMRFSALGHAALRLQSAACYRGVNFFFPQVSFSSCCISQIIWRDCNPILGILQGREPKLF